MTFLAGQAPRGQQQLGVSPTVRGGTQAGSLPEVAGAPGGFPPSPHLDQWITGSLDHSLRIGGVMHREGADRLPALPQTISLTPTANL